MPDQGDNLVCSDTRKSTWIYGMACIPQPQYFRMLWRALTLTFNTSIYLLTAQCMKLHNFTAMFMQDPNAVLTAQCYQITSNDYLALTILGHHWQFLQFPAQWRCLVEVVGKWHDRQCEGPAQLGTRRICSPRQRTANPSSSEFSLEYLSHNRSLCGKYSGWLQ